MFCEAGAAGIHIEDQKAGTKKCGHMGGKVLVSCREMKERLKALRLQFDIMGVETVLIGRCDGFSAKLLDTNADPWDQPFILGEVDPKNKQKLLTYPDAGVEAINRTFSGEKRDQILKLWLAKVYTLSLKEAVKLSDSLGFSFYFDWEATQTIEGYFRIKCGLDFVVHRYKQLAYYCDVIWMETPTPDIDVCQELSTRLHEMFPHLLLSYNCSPSFNWGLYDDKYLKNFSNSIARMGFCWQFITLAGFHMNGLASEVFSREFVKNHMYSYVKNIQEKENLEQVDQLKHQKWSGAALTDSEMEIIQGGNSNVTSLQEGCTETQFTNTKDPNVQSSLNVQKAFQHTKPLDKKLLQSKL